VATPVGHVLAGLAAGCALTPRRERLAAPLLGTCAALALAPDLDFLPGLLEGQPAAYHQGVSHSLLAAALASGLAALALGAARRGRRWVAAPLLGAYVSHLVVDFFGPDGRPPYGMPFLWPVSDQAFLAPVTLLRGVEHAETASTPTVVWLSTVFAPPNLAAIGLEVLWLAPLAALALVLRRRSHRAAAEA
jgi:membrane-bound metal-dependent hydrolase YbcI (DUF457 family)